jgi:hypothetical protein
MPRPEKLYLTNGRFVAADKYAYVYRQRRVDNLEEYAKIVVNTTSNFIEAPLNCVRQAS